MRGTNRVLWQEVESARNQLDDRKKKTTLLVWLTTGLPWSRNTRRKLPMPSSHILLRRRSSRRQGNGALGSFRDYSGGPSGRLKKHIRPLLRSQTFFEDRCVNLKPKLPSQATEEIAIQSRQRELLALETKQLSEARQALVRSDWAELDDARRPCRG